MSNHFITYTLLITFTLKKVLSYSQMFEGIPSYPSSLPDLDMVIGDHSPLPEGGGRRGWMGRLLALLSLVYSQAVSRIPLESALKKSGPHVP